MNNIGGGAEIDPRIIRDYRDKVLAPGLYSRSNIPNETPTLRVTITENLKTLDKELYILYETISRLDSVTKDVQEYRAEKPTQDNRVSPVPSNLFEFITDLISKTRTMQTNLCDIIDKLNI